jgi:hypothetical protein
MDGFNMNRTGTGSQIFGNDDRPVFQIIIYSFALAFAVLIASLESLRQSSFGFSFHISWRTPLTLVLAAAVIVPCLKTLFHAPSGKRRFAAFALIVTIGLSSFLYPLRFVQSEKFGEIFIGLTVAVCLLSAIAGFLFAISRFLSADAHQA